jgi:hypothetical protein
VNTKNAGAERKLLKNDAPRRRPNKEDALLTEQNQREKRPGEGRTRGRTADGTKSANVVQKIKVDNYILISL